MNRIHTAARRALRSIVLLTVLLIAHHAWALDPARALSQYTHRIWQVQQGLPQASIYAIVQTRDGYLWLGTQTGLVKFDGVRFTTIDEVAGVPMANIWVTQLMEDQQGALWIGTNQTGLIELRSGKATRYSQREGLPSDTVQCLFADRDHNVWVCTPNGLAELTQGAEGKQEKIRVFGAREGLTQPDIHAACLAPNGELTVGIDTSHIATWNGKTFVAHAPALPASGTVQAMLCSSDGSVWIGTSDELLHVDGARVRRLSVADGLADNSILSLMQSHDGSVLVGTKNGFSRIRGDEIESFGPQDGLSQSTVYSLYEDREETLWVATKHGLNQFFDGRAIPYTTSEGLPSNNTGPVFQDSHGIIWVGTLGSGLARFDGHRFAALTTRDGLASNSIFALAEDNAGGLWVGTDAGLNRLRQGRVDATWTTARGLPGNSVRALFRDAAGTMWIATSRGVVTFHDGALHQAPAFRTAGMEQILAFGEDRTHHLYAAPESAALQLYGDETLRSVGPPSPLLEHVDALYEDREGLMWVGTRGDGLRLINGGQIVSYSVLDGLFDDVIYGIAEDDRGRLWMACSKGIFSVDRSALLQFAAGKIRHFVSAPYSPLDVLRTLECQSGVQPVISRMRDGRLWFATIRGLLVIDPNDLERRFVPPAVAIEDVTVNGEPSRTAEIGGLAAGRNNIEFGYTGVSFLAPTRTMFRYRLEGFDKGWVAAGTRRQAFYTNLPPGRYRFRVVACNPGNACSEAPGAVAFVIEPRYYQRAWFVPLCAVAAALVGWAIYQLRIRRLREQFDLILAERGRIARELHDTLIQGFSGITMAMQALVPRLPPSGESRMLEDIIADAGDSLREARRSLSGLRGRHESQSGLADAVARAARQLTEAKQVRLKLSLDDGRRVLSANVEYNLLRIAQEAMSNAVQHSGARTLRVTLDNTPQCLLLSVKDDGVGFDEEGSPPPGHYGLVGMRERAAQIGGTFQLTSSRGRGTTVSVIVEA